MDIRYETLPTADADNAQLPNGTSNLTTAIEMDDFVDLELETPEEIEAKRLAKEAAAKLTQPEAPERKQEQNNGPLQQILKLLSVIGHQLGKLFNTSSRQHTASKQGTAEESCCLFTNPFTLLGPSTGQIKGRVTIGVEMEVVFTPAHVSASTAASNTLTHNNTQVPVQPN